MRDMTLRALIIDDENLARSRLRRLLEKYENIEVVGEARNGQEALELIKKTDPNVLFLDIKMPQLSGFEMLKKLGCSPHVIFTTAFNEYALQAFEENALDYLLKPINDEKLKRAVSKLIKMTQQGPSVPVDLKSFLESMERKKRTIKRFSVKVGDRFFLVPDSQISFFHSEDKYTFLNTEEKSYIIPFALKELEQKLDLDKFIRVHRKYIVNISNIVSIHRWFKGRLLLKMKGEKDIIVSQNYVDNFKEKIHL